MKNVLRRIKKHSSWYLGLILLVLALGVGVRVAKFPTIPPGLNVDEASSAYEAYSLAETGRDRWGNKLPAYFPGWGSGQNVLLAYLTVPFVKVLGLTIFSARIVSLLIGLLTLPLFYYAVRPLGKFPALLSLLLISFCPWHLLLSRWALESNLLPFFMLLGCAMLARALRTGRGGWIIPTLLPFSLALYAYGTTVLVLPVFFLFILLLHFPTIKQHYKQWLISVALFSICSFPFALFFIENHLLKRNIAWTDTLFFSTSLLPSNRAEQVGGDWLLVLRENIHFIIYGFDGPAAFDHRLLGHNLLFSGAVWFAAAGVLVCFYYLFKNKSNYSASKDYVTLSVFAAWVVAATVLCFFFFLNINRFNHFYMPCLVVAIWFITNMIQYVANKLNRINKSSRQVMQVAVFVLFALRSYEVVTYYFTIYPQGRVQGAFDKGLPDAFAVLRRLPVAQVRISNNMPMPYIYTLFFMRYPPAEFHEKAVYKIVDGVYEVDKFDKYIFNKAYLNQREPYGYLSRRNEFTAEGKHHKVVLYTNSQWEVGIMQ